MRQQIEVTTQQPSACIQWEFQQHDDILNGLKPEGTICKAGVVSDDDWTIAESGLCSSLGLLLQSLLPNAVSRHFLDHSAGTGSD